MPLGRTINPKTPRRKAKPGYYWLSLALYLPLALAGVHRAAYDTYVHIFFADHYRRWPFALWEPRWYGGFSVVSYPPLVHQLIALVSLPASALVNIVFPTDLPGLYRYRGEEIGFVVVLLGALAMFPVAVREFAGLFVGRRAAGWAAVAAVGLPASALTAFAFGQLPTLAGTGALLLAVSAGARYVRAGRFIFLFRAVALAGVVAAIHHGVFLLAPWLGLTVAAAELSRAHGQAVGSEARQCFQAAGSEARQCFRQAADSEARQCFRQAAGSEARQCFRLTPLVRTLIWALLSALVVVVVLWPFLQWSRGYQPQTPIDHQSRHSFVFDWEATLRFFWPMYGPLLLLMPWALWQGWRLRRRLGRLALLAAFLFVLGLGGTTPLPRWIFGEKWAWLTYDRFSFWAATALLPIAGTAAGRAERRIRPAALAVIAVYFGSAIIAALNSVILRGQPRPLDLLPVARYLAEGDRSGFRYLTLGFGDQLARLSVLTEAQTLDGSYHTAREIPELRASGLGQIDTAMWMSGGVEAAAPFLAMAERWSVRWAFSNHSAYAPVLERTGWRPIGRLENGVDVWENPAAPALTMRDAPRPSPAGLWWGLAPIMILAATLGLHLLWPVHRP